MPRRNNRKIPRKEGELGFDPSKYIGKGNIPFPDNYILNIRPDEFGGNIVSQTETMFTTTAPSSAAPSTPRHTKDKRNDTRNKRKKKHSYQYHYFNFKARVPTKRIHRAYAMIRKMRRSAYQAIETLKAEEAEEMAVLRETGSNAPASTAAAAAVGASAPAQSAPSLTTAPNQSLINKLQKFISITR